MSSETQINMIVTDIMKFESGKPYAIAWGITRFYGLSEDEINKLRNELVSIFAQLWVDVVKAIIIEGAFKDGLIGAYTVQEEDNEQGSS